MIRKLAALVAAFALGLTSVVPATAVQGDGSAGPSAVSAAPSGPTDETQVPRYFGPYPNWANSPLTLAAADVTIVGDGTGAEATATVGANGVITGIAITNPGRGYTSASVEFGGLGSGAAATAQVTTSGAVTSIDVTSGGAGYVQPQVTIGGGGGVPAGMNVGNALIDRAYATDFVAPPAPVPAAVAQAVNHTVGVTAGDATGGTFTLTVDGVTTGAIAFDAVAADVEAALTAAAIAGTATGSGPWVLVLGANDPAVSIDGADLIAAVGDASLAGTDLNYTLQVGGATGGTFGLTLDGTPVGPFAWNVAAADLQTALSGSSVTGTGSSADPWLITFGTAPASFSADFAALTQAASGFAAIAAGTWEATAGSAAGGTFALVVDGAPSAAIAWTATAAEVEAAVPGTTVTGSGPWTIVFAAPPASITMDGANLTQPPDPLVPVLVIVPTTLPDGTRTAFRSWNQATPGGSPVPSAGRAFHAYVLRPTGVADEYEVVYDSGELTVPVLSGAASEVATFNVADTPVQAGDVLGFYGSGIPVDIDAAGLDRFSYPAPAAPANGATFTFGGAGFPDFGQARTYSFGASVTIVTAPGQATATAYGGVDQVTITDFGSGYSVPTVDFDMPDLPNGVKATGHVECAEANCQPAEQGGTVTILGVVVDNPGSGYASAPGVAIRNGTLFDPITPADPGAFSPASATATLSVSSIVVETYGAGYTTAPTVTIADAVGDGTGATAEAAVDVGMVTSLELLAGGSGYVTTGGIRKFIDELPGLCTPPACPTDPDAKYIPLGVPDTSGPYQAAPDTSDSYEIGLVQYRTSFSSDLPPTLVRGYVQLETPANADISQHFPLTNELLDGTKVPVLKSDGTPWLAVTPPQWLGPTIVASKDKPVRIVFRNFLPTGEDGDLFMPVDSTMMGSGMGPMDMMEPMDEGTVMDGVRNPLCTQYPKSDMCFADNRATLHLHGGITPWISDGTPHQWITPANETTPWPEGVSVENVPDMDVCSADDDGCQTFFYTNQQSARLMFYHDHSWGITRLNVYAGEAAGYLITDETEQALLASGTIPADQLPLVIQDRTFVPDAAQLALQDPTWDVGRWGSKGSFWYHHVYMPAQNPGDPSGMSAFGRWMYGPWFWPPAGDAKHGPIANPYYDPACQLDDPATWQYDTDPFCEPPEIPGTPLISAGMEQFNDTPVVNGIAYPTITLEPKAYRLRILNAANDRFWNLQWYVGDPTTASTSVNTNGEVIGATEVALKAAELEAAQTDPVIFPTPDTSVSLPGPDWVQIGTEGGFLPSPVVVDGQQVTTWITDPTRFDVGLVDQHSMLLAPAERSDAVVDFSKFAGKTLILYNDAPAAFPARVPQYDYYTGAPDLSPAGAPTILPGYGPNTRTVMQVKIAAAPAAPAFDLTKLQNAFKHKADGSGVFESSQNPIIVGQAAYNAAYGTNFVTGGDCNSSNPSARCDGLARIDDQGGQMWNFNTLRAPNAKTAVRIEPKAIHDEMNSTSFDPFGRMTGFLGLEAVPATPGLQNFIAYPYTNPGTEFIDGTNLPQNLPPGVEATPISSGSDGTQIWKFTHNGVDTHPIHFHLYDVQVLNRVAWDNIITMTDKTELGWKDTVRISPLQDTYVALRPVIPTLPFRIPNSIRPINPMMPLGATLADANPTDPQGQPTAAIVNRLVNFAFEYVYHCHILSHEEMDMMRPVSLVMPPDKADGLTYVVTGNGGGTRLTLSWTDNSITETSFLVQRQAGSTGAWATVGTVDSPLDQANTAGETRSYIDSSFRWNSTLYSYRVVARNTAGYGGAFPVMNADATSAAIPVIRTPSNLSAVLQSVAAGLRIQLGWTDLATNETGFAVERSTDGGATFTQIAVAPPRTATGPVTFFDTAIDYDTTYTYRVATITPVGNSQYSNAATVAVPALPADPSDLTAVNGPNGNGNNRTVNLAWTDNSTNETGFTIQRSTNATFTSGLLTQTVAADTTAFSWTGLGRNTNYWFRIRAANGAVVASAWVTATPAPITTNP
ncbi:MAG TPA: multicopper oxidase domain-containing protein [Clostridia bacterium]|nr:multicopper oxidase domain-containing protein [Clostridia bacterium]